MIHHIAECTCQVCDDWRLSSRLFVIVSFYFFFFLFLFFRIWFWWMMFEQQQQKKNSLCTSTMAMSSYNMCTYGITHSLPAIRFRFFMLASVTFVHIMSRACTKHGVINSHQFDFFFLLSICSSSLYCRKVHMMQSMFLYLYVFVIGTPHHLHTQIDECQSNESYHIYEYAFY